MEKLKTFKEYFTNMNESKIDFVLVNDIPNMDFSMTSYCGTIDVDKDTLVKIFGEPENIEVKGKGIRLWGIKFNFRQLLVEIYKKDVPNSYDVYGRDSSVVSFLNSYIKSFNSEEENKEKSIKESIYEKNHLISHQISLRDETPFNFYELSSLGESLDTPVDYKYIGIKSLGETKLRQYSFEVNNLLYLVNIEIVIGYNSETKTKENLISVSFERNTSNKKDKFVSLNDLSKKDVLSVFSTVVKIVEKEINQLAPELIFLNTDDSKKLRIYEKLGRQLKGYKLYSYNETELIYSKNKLPKNVFEELYMFCKKFSWKKI